MLPENEDVAKLYFLVRNQVLIVGNKITDLNLLAIKAAMDILGVKNQADCLYRVRKLWQSIFDESQG